MSTLADAVNYVIALQRTGLLSGATRPVQMHKPKSTGPGIGRQPIKHFQTIDGYTCVIIGRNPRFLEALGTVDIWSRSQKPQYVPLRDALTMLPPLSRPPMSGKTSETGEKNKQDYPDL